ncbi:conjugal transfer protein, partial [Salmonella enterica]|nr:conjugal transfer protein [Salmonella enterica]
MKLKKVKHGLINITDQSVNMGIIFIVLGIVAAVGYTVYS